MTAFDTAKKVLPLALALGIILALSVMGAPVSKAAPATSVSISPPTQTVAPGQPFTVNVVVDPDVAIAGVQFDLSFDPSLITVNSVTEGNLLNQDGADTYFSPGTIDNGAGTIVGVAGAITAPGQTVSGPGTFAVVSFTAGGGSGSSPLNLFNVVVCDINGDPVEITVSDGSVSVGCVPPGTPSLVSPPNGQTVSTTPSLDWSDVSGATSYDVEVCSDSGCTNVVRSANVGSSQWTVSPALDSGTQYWWHARAKNSCGPGLWSSIRSFTTLSVTPPDLIPDSIAFNVKASIHRVWINWDEDLLAQAQIDWWLEAGANLDPSDVIVISPSGTNPNSGVYGETIKTKDTIDNVPCIEIRAWKKGDIHILVEITVGAESWTLHTEKKWGELHHTVLDVDAPTTAVDHTYSVEFEGDATGVYRQFLRDTVLAEFLYFPGYELVDGVIVHWWLVHDTDANQAWVDAFMDYLAAHDGGLDDDHWAAHGTYTMSDLGGREPWEYINDWVCGPDEIADTGDDRAVDPNLFYWSAVYVPGQIDATGNTRNWYAWAETDGGVAMATLSVDVDGLTPYETYEVMTVVLVSYPGGGTPQHDPFYGENSVCLEKGKIEFQKTQQSTLNPAFTADKTEVLVGETVTFTNETNGGKTPYVAAEWDFDDNGTIDSTTALHNGQTVTWQYAAPGIYSVGLKITDGDGVTRTEIKFNYIVVRDEEEGHQPNRPSDPFPSNHATGVSTNANLSWTGGDPDLGDTVTYNVYFGTSPSPSLRATIGPYGATQSSMTYDPGTLVDGTTYYWRIVARDNHGITREGPVWDFTAGGVLQDEPSPEVGFASIGDQLIIAYYYAGFGVWDVYWPEFGIDTIGALEVGEIYQIYVESDCTLEYGTHSYELNGPDWNFIYWLGC